MVYSSLHIICGNCGSYLTYGNENNEKARAEINHTPNEPIDVFITCENCDTTHSLSEYMEILE